MKSSKLFLYVIFIFAGVFYMTSSYSENATVEMLNKFENDYMVYSKKIVKINSGDTVFWKATDKGHNVEFIKKGVPEGVGKFKSKYNKDTEYKFTIPGIYAYWCTPHKTMGMIGFIVVGDDKSNLETIKAIRFSGKSKKIALDLISQI
jgi:pseudoazurin